MNSNLYGHKISLPEDVISYLKKCHESAIGADETTEGYKRNMELRDSGEVTYQQLKRIKNWFDSFNGHENDLPFILNGGHYVKNWVHDTLTSLRDGDNLSKEIKSTVLDNQFIDTHEKNNINNLNRPSERHKSAVDRHDTAINESLRRINEIMKKIV